MWIKNNLVYRSFFMIVRLGFANGITIPIPIPLFLLDQTLDVIEDFVWLGEKLLFYWTIPLHHQNDFRRQPFRYWMSFAGTPSKALKLCREIIWELRRYGKWRMVEVEACDPKSCSRIRVYVDFI